MYYLQRRSRARNIRALLPVRPYFRRFPFFFPRISVPTRVPGSRLTGPPSTMGFICRRMHYLHKHGDATTSISVVAVVALVIGSARVRASHLCSVRGNVPFPRNARKRALVRMAMDCTRNSRFPFPESILTSFEDISEV